MLRRQCPLNRGNHHFAAPESRGSFTRLLDVCIFDIVSDLFDESFFGFEFLVYCKVNRLANQGNSPVRAMTPEINTLLDRYNNGRLGKNRIIEPGRNGCTSLHILLL